MGVRIHSQILMLMHWVVSPNSLFICLFLEPGSLMRPSLTKDNLEFLILLPLPQQCWDCRGRLPCAAGIVFTWWFYTMIFWFWQCFFSKVLENFQCFCLLVLCVSCSLLGGSELLWLIIVRTIVFPPMSFVVAVGFWGGLSLFIPAHNVVQAILELLPGPSISVLLTDCLTPTSLRVLFRFVLHLKQSGKNNTDLYLLIRLYL